MKIERKAQRIVSTAKHQGEDKKTTLIVQQLQEKICELQDKNSRLRIAQQVYDFSCDGIIVSDHNNRMIYINDAMQKLSGFTEEELLGKDPKVLGSGLQEKAFYDKLWATLKEKQVWQGEIINRAKNGQCYPVYTSITTIPGVDGGPVNFVAIHRDIRAEKRAREMIAYQTAHDSLTGLLNRHEFNNQLEHYIQSAETSNNPAAFLIINIDNFKSINEFQGHLAGDNLLKKVASALQKLCTADQLLARVGGDEFGLFCRYQDKAEIQQIIDTIHQLFSTSFTIEEGLSINASASIGVSLYPDNADNTKNLFACANQALSLAKHSSYEHAAFFNEELRNKALRAEQVIARLKIAIEQQALEPYFQPIISVSTGLISHLEVLARWQDEELGRVFPDEFIKIAEENNLMQALSDCIFNKALAGLQEVNHKLRVPLSLSLNRSPQEFMNDSHCCSNLLDIIHLYGIDPALVTIELTESLMVQNPQLAKKQLEHLRSLGFKIAMDDFGTGYSSLAYLKQFPFDYLKIDRSFVTDMCNNEDDKILVKTIIDMAHNFGMKTIAEGVEETDQYNLLNHYACDFIQGYLFSPPLCLQDLKNYISQQHPEQCLRKSS